MTSPKLLAIPFLLIAACAEPSAPQTPGSELEITTNDATTIEGSFVHAGSVVDFQSVSQDQHTASLHFDVNGAALDVTFETGGEVTEDGHGNAVFAEDVTAVNALRDALSTELADSIENTLQGRLLVRYTDRLADAAGMTFQKFTVNLKATVALPGRNAQAGCGGDGVTCESGTNGWDYAYFSNSAGVCYYWYSQYGDSAPNCAGRCGAGCAWYDHDYTWDCLDHDRCIDAWGGSTTTGNANCTDEFWDASDDWAATVGSWC
jgi:hypothetical protein